MNKQQGVGVLPVIVLLVIVSALGFVGYSVYRSSHKSQPAATNQTKNTATTDESALFKAGYISINDRVHFSGSLDEEVRKVGFDRLVPFYKEVLKIQSAEKICDNTSYCPEYKSFLTDSAIEQLKNPAVSSPLICGQSKVESVYIGEPVLSGQKGSVIVKMLPFSVGIDSFDTVKLGLVKVQDTWLIESFSCQ